MIHCNVLNFNVNPITNLHNKDWMLTMTAAGASHNCILLQQSSAEIGEGSTPSLIKNSRDPRDTPRVWGAFDFNPEID